MWGFSKKELRGSLEQGVEAANAQSAHEALIRMFLMCVSVCVKISEMQNPAERRWLKLKLF